MLGCIRLNTNKPLRTLRPALSGSIEVSFSLRCGSAFVLLLYFVFMMASEDKPSPTDMWSQREGESHTAFPESAGHSLCCCFPKSNNDRLLKAEFNVSSHDNSVTLSLSVKSSGIPEVSIRVSRPVVRLGRH